MSLILLIETATTSCSVALGEGPKILALNEIDQRNVHAEVITLYVEDCLKKAGKSYNELDAVAVSSGPGSYTGLRIGVSTAKGLCYALDKPLITIDTLAAMSNGYFNRFNSHLDPETLLCPMIDARRMEVYTALFDAKGNTVRATTAEIIDEHSFKDVLNTHPIIFFGDGASKCRETLSHYTNAVFEDRFVNSAADMLMSALQKFKARDFADIAYFEPYYLKDFIAGKKKE